MSLPLRYPLGDSLAFLQRLWRLNHALEQLSSRMEKTLGVTAQQRMLIRCIGTHPGLSPSQLASILHLDRGTLSATLRRLEQKGLIDRRRDPDDSRRVTIGLTFRGRDVDHPTEATVEAAVTNLLATTPASEIAITLTILDRLTAEVDAQLQPGGASAVS